MNENRYIRRLTFWNLHLTWFLSCFSISAIKWQWSFTILSLGLKCYNHSQQFFALLFFSTFLPTFKTLFASLENFCILYNNTCIFLENHSSDSFSRKYGSQKEEYKLKLIFNFNQMRPFFDETIFQSLLLCFQFFILIYFHHQNWIQKKWELFEGNFYK